MNKRLTLAIASAACALTGSAWAADLPPAPPMAFKAPVAVPWTWTGAYGGANGGYSWGNWDSTSATAIFPGPGGTFTNTASPNVQGAVAGGQGGYNWQFAPQWLLGIEGDIDWSGERASDGGNSSASGLTVGFPQGLGACDAHFPCTTTVTGTTANNWNLDWFATLRARLGFVADQTWLFYGTGGIAFAGVGFSSSTSTTTTITNSIGQIVNPVTATAGGSPVTTTGGGGANATRVGFAVGGGVEKMFAQNWSVKVEYLFMDFGSDTFLTGTANATNVKLIDNLVRVGINYKFWTQ